MNIENNASISKVANDAKEYACVDDNSGIANASGQSNMAAYKRMELFAKNNEIQQEAILAKMQKVAGDIEQNRLGLETNLRQSIDRVFIELTQVPIKMQEGFEAQKMLPAKRRAQFLAAAFFFSLFGGLVVSLAGYYYNAHISDEIRHQRVAGKVLQESWSKLSVTDKNSIMSIALGVDAPEVKGSASKAEKPKTAGKSQR